MATARRWIGWSTVAALPFLVLALLLGQVVPDPTWMGFNFHFLIVSLTAFIALIMATMMVIAASQLKDARVVFLSLAFLGIAGTFTVHGLTTPGAIVPGVNPWIGFAARLSMLVGALFFALSTVVWGSRIERAIIRRQRSITLLFSACLIGFGVLALASSLHHGQTAAATTVVDADGDSYGVSAAPVAIPLDLGPFRFLNDQLVGRAVTVATLALLAAVIWRYVALYRISRTPLLGGFLVSSLFIFQAQVSMVTAPVWHASWWEYHILLFGSFGAAIAGMVLEYGRNGSLQGVVEGLLLRDTIAQLQRGYTEVIVALVRAVEAKDVYTRGHTQRVSDLAVRVGQELKLSPERLRVLGRAAMLHDIGKIAVPDSILNKPGALTADEFEIVKQHPVRGHAIIKDVRSLQAEIGGVRNHHERWDGAGYPDGLAGERIPLEARIIAVADVYDALSSPRPYRGAWTPERALALIRKQAGAQFDPRCVEALVRALELAPCQLPLDETPAEPWALAAS